MNETWKPVIEHHSDGYEVSDLGRVRRIRTGNILKPYVRKTGYHTVNLYVTEGGTPIGTSHFSFVVRRVHVLVAEAFLGPKPQGMDVNHVDGDKGNNALSNLEYMTRSANHRHAYDTGLKHGGGKLTDEQVREIRASTDTMTSKDWAKRVGLSPSFIRSIRAGTWYKQVR